MDYLDPYTNEKFIPHVVEPTFGLSRTVLMILLSAYDEEEVDGETRVVMRFAKHLAPYKVAVLPLSNKLVDDAKEIWELLSPHAACDFDTTGSIGKRYRRQDEIGTPYCVTYDFDSGEDGMVTIRDRDTMEQERVKITDLVAVLSEKMAS